MNKVTTLTDVAQIDGCQWEESVLQSIARSFGQEHERSFWNDLAESGWAVKRILSRVKRTVGRRLTSWTHSWCTRHTVHESALFNRTENWNLSSQIKRRIDHLQGSISELIIWFNKSSNQTFLIPASLSDPLSVFLTNDDQTIKWTNKYSIRDDWHHRCLPLLKMISSKLWENHRTR